MISASIVKPKIPWRLVVILLVLMLIIGFFWYYYYQKQIQALTMQKLQDLATVAEIKVKQLTEWRRERLSDANFLARYQDIGFLTDRLLFNLENRVARRRIVDILNSMYQN